MQRVLISPATAPENSLDACETHVRWEPQEEGVMCTAVSFPSERNQGYRTSRIWTNTCTQQNQETLPQCNSEVVNLTGLLKTKD